MMQTEREYAEALFTLATEENEVGSYLTSLQTVKKLLEADDTDGAMQYYLKMTDKLQQAIIEEAKKQFVYALNRLKIDNADILNAYQKLNSTHNKKFYNMLKNLKDPEDYFKYIQFQMDIIPTFI